MQAARLSRRWSAASAAFAALAAVAVSVPGCVVAAAAAAAAGVFGTVQYFANEATEDYRADVDAVRAAALAVLAEQGYGAAPRVTTDATRAEIEVGDVSIKIERQPGEFTRARVRVGTFDTDEHKRRAGLILEGIRKKLA